MASRARAVAGFVAVFAVLALAGCGGGGGGSASKGGGSSGGSSSGGGGTTVSAACDSALSALARGGKTNTDAEELKAQRATLDACMSRAEWLAGAEQYRGSELDNMIVGTTKATVVLSSFCQGNKDAPACSR